MKTLVPTLLAALLCVLPAMARADEPEGARVEAAESYDRGVRAFRERDYPAAARWFEAANRLAPSPAALVQAIRAHRNARNTMRAGTLALVLENDSTLSPSALETIARALSTAGSRFVRIDVACTARCQLTVDGEDTSFNRFFAEANREIVIVATFRGGTRTETVSGRPGSVRSVGFEAPPGSEEPEVAEAPEDLALEAGENPYRISRLRFLSRPRATFFMTLTSTSVIGGVAVWSGVDARRSREAVEDAIDTGATSEELAVLRARHRQDVKRTRGYLGFSGLLVLTTGLVAAFTDWTPNGDTDATVEASRDGATLSLRRRF